MRSAQNNSWPQSFKVLHLLWGWEYGTYYYMFLLLPEFFSLSSSAKYGVALLAELGCGWGRGDVGRWRGRGTGIYKCSVLNGVEAFFPPSATRNLSSRLALMNVV